MTYASILRTAISNPKKGGLAGLIVIYLGIGFFAAVFLSMMGHMPEVNFFMKMLTYPVHIWHVIGGG